MLWDVKNMPLIVYISKLEGVGSILQVGSIAIPDPISDVK